MQVPTIHASLRVGLFGPTYSPQRQAACDEERKAQWADYYARKQADEDRRRQAQADADAERERAAQAERARQEEQLHARHVAYHLLQAAENSPDNHCKDPDTARAILQAWNDMDAFKDINLRAVDIEHLTTTSWGTDNRISCHGLFITNRGMKSLGTLTIKKNVAGDPISSWQPDADQDTSSYEAPPPEQILAESAVKDVGAQREVAPAATENQKPPAFSAGLADRQGWEVWIGALPATQKDGATWWATNRNAPVKVSCVNAEKKDDAEWLAGCLNAQQKLTPIDLKRRADPAYKQGWNSF